MKDVITKINPYFAVVDSDARVGRVDSDHYDLPGTHATLQRGTSLIIVADDQRGYKAFKIAVHPSLGLIWVARHRVICADEL